MKSLVKKFGTHLEEHIKYLKINPQFPDAGTQQKNKVFGYQNWVALIGLKYKYARLAKWTNAKGCKPFGLMPSKVRILHLAILRKIKLQTGIEPVASKLQILRSTN